MIRQGATSAETDHVGAEPRPSYLELRARFAAQAPECYRCFEVRRPSQRPHPPHFRGNWPRRAALFVPPLLAGTAALSNPEAARAAIGATIGNMINAQPARPSISVLTALFPNAVPGYDQERGLSLSSAPPPQDLAEGRGIHSGPIAVFPSLEFGTLYDSNVLGVRGSPGSAVLVTAPTVSAVGDYSRAKIGAYAGLEDSTYLNQPRQSRTDFKAAIGGTFNLGRGDLTLGYSHLSLHDDPTAIGSIPSTTPTPYNVDDVRASVNIVLGKLSLQPFVDYSRWTYGSSTFRGGSFSQRGRDRDIVQAGTAARYQIGEQRDLLASVSVESTRFLNSFQSIPKQDSTGVLALGGAEWEFDGALRLRALAGVQARSFNNRAFRDRVVPVGQVALTWTPQRTTQVTLTASRSLEDLAQEDAGGTIFTRAQIAVQQELRRYLALRARLGLTTAEFLQVGGTQAAGFAALGFEWDINRHWKLVGDAEISRVSNPIVAVTSGPAGTSGGPYTRVQTGLRLTTAL